MDRTEKPLNGKRKSTYSRNASDKDEEEQFCIQPGEGLLLILQPHDGSLEVRVVKDKHYPDIHANCYAPADLNDVRLLHGGGSGAAVFGGHHPELRSVVLKHAGPKDANEVFSLAQIGRELRIRGANSTTTASSVAAQDMERRIPRFVMAYISCFHVRNRVDEPWNSLRTVSYSSLGTRWSFGRSISNCSNVSENSNAEQQAIIESTSCVQLHQGDEIRRRRPRQVVVVGNTSREESGKSDVLSVDSSCVYVDIPYSKTSDGRRVVVNGECFLASFAAALIPHLQCHSWKITIGQRMIGGNNPKNGADVFTSRNLKGDLLRKLLDEFTLVIKHLEALVEPQERCAHSYDRMVKEVHLLSEIEDVRVVSNDLDSLTGNAIRKNFHPVHGRFPRMRIIGRELRRGELLLDSTESVPAAFLGVLLNPGCDMRRVFGDSVSSTCSAMDFIETDVGWLSVLQQATQFDANEHLATESIWTSGLTDAGLHNTFLSLERGLEIFDLGEPSLKPRTAFLTKFLMSFFHTPGMEEDGIGSWKVRFSVDKKNKLSLTPDTKTMIEYCHETFEAALGHFMKHMFGNDERIRRLLLHYVVLQLLSDASFCLHRWEAKGGGTQRCGESQKQQDSGKWLWRSVWDLFIASSVCTKYLQTPGTATTRT